MHCSLIFFAVHPIFIFVIFLYHYFLHTPFVIWQNIVDWNKSNDTDNINNSHHDKKKLSFAKITTITKINLNVYDTCNLAKILWTEIKIMTIIISTADIMIRRIIIYKDNNNNNKINLNVYDTCNTSITRPLEKYLFLFYSQCFFFHFPFFLLFFILFLFFDSWSNVLL